MVNITAELVQKLREKTGARMMDCKKALVESKTENENDLLIAAEIWLRKKSLGQNIPSRPTMEGRLGH